MSTLSHPAPMAPRRRYLAKSVRTRRQVPIALAVAEPAPDSVTDPNTRSALPLALFWFGIPAALLVLAAKFHWFG